MPQTFERSQLEVLAAQCGLIVSGALSISQVDASLAIESEHLASWQASGYAGEMGFMLRPVELFRDVRNCLPECRSILSFVVSYFQGDILSTFGPCPKGSARVARYAWGEDYHTVLRARLTELMALVERKLGSKVKWRGFSDAVPLLERALAAQAGLGFVGRNSMLIRPSVGSFTFVAEVLSELEIIDDMPRVAQVERGVAANAAGEGCGSCTRCVNGCPTGAIVGDGVIDAPRCISYLTIEKRGALSSAERKAVGEWVFGCDICQEVCPFNHRGIEESELQEFKSGGVGPYLDLKSVLECRSAEQFSKRFGRSALTRAGREQLIRNACAVIANQNLVELEDSLIECQESDPADSVKGYCAEALQCIR